MSADTTQLLQSAHLIAWDDIQNALHKAHVVCDYTEYRHHYAWHQHPGVEYLYIRSGTGTLLFTDKRIPYHGNTLVRIDGRVPHGMETVRPTNRWYVLYDPQLVQRWNTPLITPPQDLSISIFRTDTYTTERLENLFPRILAETDSTRPVSRQLLALYITELHLLTENMQGLSHTYDIPVASPTNVQITRRLEIVLAYIQTNLGEHLSANIIGDAVHFSASHVYKVVRTGTGQSLGDYIRNLRIERAKTLLKTTTMQVKDIAAEVGIPHAPYFCQLFRKMVGTTPGDYRRGPTQPTSNV